MPGVCIAGAEIIESILSDTILFGADLRNTKWNVVDLSNGNLNYCNFHGAFIYRVDFTGTTLRYANFPGAVIIGADFLDADLTGTDFSGAKFINVKNLTKRQMAQTVGTPDILPDLPE